MVVPFLLYGLEHVNFNHIVGIRACAVMHSIYD